MEVQKITIAEALKQGYKLCLIDDAEYCTKLENLQDEDLSLEEYRNSEIFVCEKNPTFATLEEGSILERLHNEADDDPTNIFPDEYCSEELSEKIENIFFDDKVREAEKELIEVINQAIERKTGGIYMATNLQIVE